VFNNKFYLKTAISILLISLSCSLSFAQDLPKNQEECDWSYIHSGDDKYSFKIPGTPRVQIQKVTSILGILNVRTFWTDCSKEPNSRNILYMTSGAMLPDKFLKDENANKIDIFLNEMIKEAITNSTGKKISDKKILYRNYSGRELKVSLNNGKGIMIARFFIINQIYYVHIVVTKKEKASNLFIKRFFDSFDYKK
jgi:hypothetical protein